MDAGNQEFTVIVFSKPASVATIMTCTELKKAHIQHEVVDITVDLAARSYIFSLGYLHTPLIVAEPPGHEDIMWSGFQPDRIKELVACSLDKILS